MMVAKSIGAGISQIWTNKRLLVPFYLANLFGGLLIMLPFAGVLDDFVWKSQMKQKLGQAFDYDFLFELLHHSDSGLAGVQGLILGVPLAYLLMAVFLSGGALVVLARKEKYTPAAFWGGAAAYCGRFIRLTLMGLPVLAAFFCLRYLETLVQWVIFGADPYEYIIYWGAWIKMALGYFGLILYGLIFDYARIHLVLTDNRQARKSLWQGARFAARHLRQTLALALVLLLTGWVILVVYNIFSNILTAPSWLVLVLLVIGQQLYIISRMTLRLTTYSSEMTLYRRLLA
ncbi:hypothetical protein ACFLQW_01860 [Candidatus Zixiibacteriota bacterium]